MVSVPITRHGDDSEVRSALRNALRLSFPNSHARSRQKSESDSASAIQPILTDGDHDGLLGLLTRSSAVVVLPVLGKLAEVLGAEALRGNRPAFPAQADGRR